MGRAIEMEKRLDTLEFKVNEILLMLDELANTNTTQEHIDLHEETKEEKAVGSLISESQLLRVSLIKTQEVLSSYIEFNKHTEQFTKYVRDKNGKQDKRDSKKSVIKK
jgi:hypothetical protein